MNSEAYYAAMAAQEIDRMTRCFERRASVRIKATRKLSTAKDAYRSLEDSLEIREEEQS